MCSTSIEPLLRSEDIPKYVPMEKYNIEAPFSPSAAIGLLRF
jgi:hypothetical protein